MAFIHSPKIITDGLVFTLDAANPKSYPGSGTIWNDLSGNNNTGTLTNGPTFLVSASGAISFDGTNDFVNFGNTLNFTAQPFTVECWFNKRGNSSSNTFGGALISKGAFGADNGWAMFTNNTGAAGFQIRVNNVVYQAATSFTLENNSWYHLIGVRHTVDKKIYLYVNGIFHSEGNEATTTNPTSTKLLLVGTVDGYSRHFNGLISNVKVYNKILSTDEVLQNFNATRSRFGI